MVNVAARRITGAHRAARLDLLRLTAGVTSVRNMSIQQSGLLILRALEASNSPLHIWAQKKLQGTYARGNWHSTHFIFVLPKPFQGRSTFHGFHEIEYVDSWSICLLDQCVKDAAPPEYAVPSIFHAEADLIVANNAMKESFYHFQNAANWFDVGMQVLETVKWRPDCLRTKEANLKRMLSPNIPPRHPITVGSPTMCRWYTD